MAPTDELLPADLVLEALLAKGAEDAAWSEWTALAPTVELRGPDGPVWMRLLPADPRMPASREPVLCRAGGHGAAWIEHPTRLLFVLGLVADPLAPAIAITDPASLAVLSRTLEPALPGRWGWARPSVADPAAATRVAAIGLASDSGGPFVAIESRLCAPTSTWRRALAGGPWRCAAPTPMPRCRVPLVAGEIRLPREAVRSLEPGDLLFPDLAGLDAGGRCEARFAGRRYACRLERGAGSGPARARPVGAWESLAGMTGPSIPGDDDVGPEIELELRLGSLDAALPELLGEVAPDERAAELSLPYVDLVWADRTLAVAELVSTSGGLALEVVRAKRRRR